MSTRSCLTSAAAFCIALAVFSSHAIAAGDAARADPVWKGLVPDDAFLAIVADPRRVLTSKSLAKIDVQSFADDWEPEIGFSPLDVEQTVVLVGPLVAVNEFGRGSPQFAILCRLSKDFDRDRLVKLWFRWPERFLVAGHRCFRQPQTQARHNDDEPAACFLDDRTFVYATQSWLPAMLRAHDAESKLIHALASSDRTVDLTMVFASTDGARGVTAAAFPENRVPEPMLALAKFSDLASAAKLTIQTSPEIELKLTVVANDESAASDIADLAKVLQQIGRQGLVQRQRFQPPRNVRPEARASADYWDSLATKFVDQFVAQRSGKYVTVEIGHLGSVEEMFDKAIMPPIRAEQAAERVAAARTQNALNLKQISMAMLFHAQTDGALPTHAIYSKDGKPLLSWRVAILPVLGEGALYKQFHLDEPWDSSHNKALIAKIPAVFKSAAGQPLVPGQTRFLVAVGEGTLFDGRTGVALKDIADGIANTVEVIEVGPDRAVTWTKPDDLQFDAQNPLAGLGTIGDDGFSVALANGSTPTIHKSIDPETFRWLILRGWPPDRPQQVVTGLLRNPFAAGTS